MDYHITHAKKRTTRNKDRGQDHEEDRMLSTMFRRCYVIKKLSNRHSDEAGSAD